MYLEIALQKMYIADLSSYIFFIFLKKAMKHQTKLTLTSTPPEHIGLKNRPRDYETRYKIHRKQISSHEFRQSNPEAKISLHNYIQQLQLQPTVVKQLTVIDEKSLNEMPNSSKSVKT